MGQDNKFRQLMRRAGIRTGDLVIAGTTVVLTGIILLTACNVTYTSRTQPPVEAGSPAETPTGDMPEETGTTETNEMPQPTAAGREE